MREKIATHNIDFKKSLSKQREDIYVAIEELGSSVLLVQEARDTFLYRVLPDSWETNQVITSKDKRGSAVCWDGEVWDATRRPRGLVFGVAGKGINPRWISFQNLRHIETGTKVRFISLHLPPRRGNLTRLQPFMIDKLVHLVQRTKRAVVIGGDFNTLLKDDKYHIARRTGLVKRHGRIDGFFISPRLDPGRAIVGPDVNSPHHPVTVKIEV
jgi:endonuclease/exonuclease/phosphatase family metal-dependent hydrolase